MLRAEFPPLWDEAEELYQHAWAEFLELRKPVGDGAVRVVAQQPAQHMRVHLRLDETQDAKQWSGQRSATIPRALARYCAPVDAVGARHGGQLSTRAGGLGTGLKNFDDCSGAG